MDELGEPVDIKDGQLPHLVTFSTAAELGSLTGAAKALGLTQAAVSQRIQVLEKSLKKSLFDRRGGRVSLTEANLVVRGGEPSLIPPLSEEPRHHVNELYPLRRRPTTT